MSVIINYEEFFWQVKLTKDGLVASPWQGCLKSGAEDSLARTWPRVLKDLVMVCIDDFKFSEAPNVHYRSLSGLGSARFLLQVSLVLQITPQIIENLSANIRSKPQMINLQVPLGEFSRNSATVYNIIHVVP